MRRIGKRFGVALVVVTLFAAGCADVSGKVQAPSDGGEGVQALSSGASAGLETFRTVGCSACHGQDGEGGVGPALAGHTEDQLFRQVRTPKGDVMPPFPTDVLSDDDVRDIYAWIVTLGDEMVMVHAEEGEEGEDGAHGPELTATEVAHMRLALLSLDAENTDDAIRHVEHMSLHGGDSDLMNLAEELETEIRAGNLHAAEQEILEALGPDISEHFDVVTAHVGMALSANERDEDQDVEYHLSQAAGATVRHDHEETLTKLLEDWRSGEDRHGVIDGLYEALGLDHPQQ
ncbi:MAG: hypothetical protein BMS9Abin12_2048 [Acidimicrobiia bacterium]|nr:MAG: hypothetical protein BMS9Abin12_2048 [Acidimicrobiia bacterium]